MRHTSGRVLAAVAFAGLLSASVIAEQKYKGLTAAEWSAAWWQTLFATPVEGGRHPLFDGGAFGGNNGTVFVSAPIVPAGSGPTTNSITVSAGTHLVIPIVTVECSMVEEPPFHGSNPAQLRECANGLLDVASDPYAEIDGTPVANPAASRVESPLFRFGPLPSPNALGLVPGTQSDAVSTGYFLLPPPLSVGQHQIIVRANIAEFGLAVDAELIIDVEPPRGR